MIACGLAAVGSDHAFGANWCDPLCFTDHGFFIQHVWSHQKHIPISSATGLTVETFVILPAALIYILGFSSVGLMAYPLSTNLLLIGAGVVTAIPLLLFAEATKSVSYITLGFIQYVNPTIMLLLAVFLFHESYSLAQFTAFGFIWLGIAVFTYGTLGAVWKRRRDLATT